MEVECPVRIIENECAGEDLDRRDTNIMVFHVSTILLRDVTVEMTQYD